MYETNINLFIYLSHNIIFDIFKVISKIWRSLSAIEKFKLISKISTAKPFVKLWHCAHFILLYTTLYYFILHKLRYTIVLTG